MQTQLRALRFSLTLASALLLAARSDAALIVSNFGESLRSATPIANPVYWGAQSFTPDADYDLTSVSLRLGNATGVPDAVIELRSADASTEIDQTPAGLLTTFAGPGLSGPLAPRVFTPSLPVTLRAGTLYWLVVGTHTEGFDWGYVADTEATIGAIGNFADSEDAGATWRYGDFSFPYYIEVQGVVPEPGTLALVGLGLAGLAACGRREA